MSAQRRALIAIVTVALVSLMATACGSGDSGDGDQVTLRIWDFSDEQVEFHKEVAARSPQGPPQHPHRVALDHPGRLQEPLPLAFQSHQAPDIFYWSDNPPAMNLLLDQGWIRRYPGGGTLPPTFTAAGRRVVHRRHQHPRRARPTGSRSPRTSYWGPGYMYINSKVFADAGLDPDEATEDLVPAQAACAQIESKTTKV